MSQQQVNAANVRPEDLDEFRQARLLLLLDRLAEVQAASTPDIERLSYYDFFAANPFLVPLSDAASATAALAGFIKANLSYQSSSQRFANNRARLQFDLACLVSRRLVQIEVSGRRITYRLTSSGTGVASRFQSLYARGYRRSAELILEEIRRLSDSALRNSAKEWLKAEALMVDLYDVEAPA
jgi:hypothetical protein